MIHREWWWITGILAVILSQTVIILSWSDAKFGTIPNIVILIVIIASMGIYFFEQNFKNDVNYNFKHNNDLKQVVPEEKDLNHLPDSVRKYLHYTGVIQKTGTRNFYAAFDGIMRDRQKEFSFTSEQYNFFKEPARLFFMKGKIFGISVPGYHKYMGQEAEMVVKLFGIIPVVKEKGEIMYKSETVTTFAELCFFAPSLLTGKNIVWEEIDDLTAKARFTNKNITISATLFFNSEGQLIRFASDDRYDISDMTQYRFSVPVSDYKNFNGYNVPTSVELIWHYPDGEFVYGQLWLKNIKYNLDYNLD